MLNKNTAHTYTNIYIYIELAQLVIDNLLLQLFLFDCDGKLLACQRANFNCVHMLVSFTLNYCSQRNEKK